MYRNNFLLLVFSFFVLCACSGALGQDKIVELKIGTLGGKLYSKLEKQAVDCLQDAASQMAQAHDILKWALEIKEALEDGDEPPDPPSFNFETEVYRYVIEKQNKKLKELELFPERGKDAPKVMTYEDLQEYLKYSNALEFIGCAFLSHVEYHYQRLKILKEAVDELDAALEETEAAKRALKVLEDAFEDLARKTPYEPFRKLFELEWWDVSQCVRPVISDRKKIIKGHFKVFSKAFEERHRSLTNLTSNAILILEGAEDDEGLLSDGKKALKRLKGLEDQIEDLE